MKFIKVFCIVISILTCTIGLAQIKGGRDFGQPIYQEVPKATVHSGVISGEVNLFNGTYNTSIDLGTVSTPAGLSFTATLNHNSELQISNNEAFASGIPYGEGWSLNIPSITVNNTMVKPDADWYRALTQPNSNAGEVSEQALRSTGFQNWSEPYLSIPGKFSGELVLKHFRKMGLKDENGNELFEAVFVPRQFEEYLEAVLRIERELYYEYKFGNKFFGDSYKPSDHYITYVWEVTLPNGETYEFKLPVYGVRSAPNQRMSNYNTDTTLNSILPKFEINRWLLTSIKHKEQPFQKIYFNYERFGNFNYLSEYSQIGVNRALRKILNMEEFEIEDLNPVELEIVLNYVYFYTKGLHKPFFNLFDNGDTVFLKPNELVSDPSLFIYKDFILKSIDARINVDTYLEPGLNHPDNSIESSIQDDIVERLEFEHSTFKNYPINYDNAITGLRWNDSASNILKRGQAGVVAYDSMYNVQSIYRVGGGNYLNHIDTLFFSNGNYSAFNAWRRYRHTRSSMFVDSITRNNIFFNNGLSPINSNPYAVANSQSVYYPESAIDILNHPNALSFDHGFLESNKLPTLHPGEEYELKTKLATSSNFINSKFGSYDFSVVTGMRKSGVGASGKSILVSDMGLFNTFNSAIKWNFWLSDAPNIQASNASVMFTTNSFVVPNNVLLNDSIKLRIGPSNSDNNFQFYEVENSGNPDYCFTSSVRHFIWHKTDTSIGLGIVNSPRIYSRNHYFRFWDNGDSSISVVNPSNVGTAYALGSYYNILNTYRKNTLNNSPHCCTLGSNCTSPSTLNTGPISNNFGAGLPWYMMLGFLDKAIDTHQHSFAPPFNSHRNFALFPFLSVWWHRAGPHFSSFGNSSSDSMQIKNWVNRPTFADSDVRFSKVELVRKSKNPYLLSSVKKYIRNGINTVSSCPLDLKAGHHLERNLKLNYIPTQVEVRDNRWSPDTVNPVSQRVVYLLTSVEHKSLVSDTTLTSEVFEYKRLHLDPSFKPTLTINSIFTSNVHLPVRSTVYRPIVLYKVTNSSGDEKEIEYYPLHDSLVRLYIHDGSTMPLNIGGPDYPNSMIMNYIMNISLPVKRILHKKNGNNFMIKEYNYEMLHRKNKYAIVQPPPFPQTFRGLQTKEDPSFLFDMGYGRVTETHHINSNTSLVRVLTNSVDNRFTWGKLLKSESLNSDGLVIDIQKSSYGVSLAFLPANKRKYRQNLSGGFIITPLDTVGISLDSLNGDYWDMLNLNTPNFKTININDPIYRTLNLNPSKFTRPNHYKMRDQDSIFFVFLDTTISAEFDYPTQASTLVAHDKQYLRGQCNQMLDQFNPTVHVINFQASGGSPSFTLYPRLTLSKYSYYQANHRGLSNNTELKRLMYTDVIDYPNSNILLNRFNENFINSPAHFIANSYLSKHARTMTDTLNPNIRKFYNVSYEPSWQVSSVLTYSPQSPNTFTRKEFYYYHDLAKLFLRDSNKIKPTYFQPIATNFAITPLMEHFITSGLRSVPFRTDVVSCSNERDTVRVTDFIIYDRFKVNSYYVREAGVVDTAINLNDVFYNKYAGPPYGGPPCILPSFNYDSLYFVNCNLVYRKRNSTVVVDTNGNVTPKTVAQDYSIFAFSRYQRVVSNKHRYPANMQHVDLGVHRIYIPPLDQDRKALDNEFQMSKYNVINAYRVGTRNYLSQIMEDQDINGRFNRYEYFKPIIKRYTFLNITKCRYILHQLSYEALSLRVSILYSPSKPIMIINDLSLFFKNDPITFKKSTYFHRYSYDNHDRLHFMSNSSNDWKRVRYDQFGRVTSVSSQDRLSTAYMYSLWDGNTQAGYQARTRSNHITTFNFTSANRGVVSRSYYEPIGRLAQTVTSTFTQGSGFDTGQPSYVVNAAEVFSGEQEYDDLQRVTKQYKNFGKQRPPGGNPLDLFPNTQNTSQTSPLFEQYQYNNDFASMLRRKSNFGVDIVSSASNTIRANQRFVTVSWLKQQYNIPTNIIEKVAKDHSTKHYLLIENEAIDQDGKITRSYTKSNGQLILTVAGANGLTPSFTYTLYDKFGNASAVVHPNQLQSENRYNLLGHVYQSFSPDRSTVRYVRNTSGLVVFEQDTILFRDSACRMYQYDSFNRVVSQSILRIPIGATQFRPFNEYSKPNMDLGATVFEKIKPSSLVIAPGVKEKEFFYDSIVHNKPPFLSTKALSFFNNNRYRQGKLHHSISYDQLSVPIQYKVYSYNQRGNISYIFEQGNPLGISLVDTGLVTVIEHKYTYTDKIHQMNIDINADNNLDFFVRYIYDTYDRVVKVIGGHDYTVPNPFVLAEYTYNDVNGLVTEIRYRHNNQQIDTLTYGYDEARDRLTSIESRYWDYKLFYDQNIPQGHVLDQSYNFNGNINSTTSKFKSTALTFLNSGVPHPSLVLGYKYDPLNRLTHVNTPTGDVLNNLVKEEFTYDAVGNILTQKQGNSATMAYSYFPNSNRLQNVTNYSQVGNRVFTYSSTGNVISDNGPTYKAFNYTRGNLLRSMSKVLNGADSIRYTYDASDHRLSKMASLDDTMQYFLRDFSGREIGEVRYRKPPNSQAYKGNWTWYVYGALGERFASYTPPWSAQPSYYTPNTQAFDNSGKTGTADTISHRLMNASPYLEYIYADSTLYVGYNSQQLPSMFFYHNSPALYPHTGWQQPNKRVHLRSSTEIRFGKGVRLGPINNESHIEAKIVTGGHTFFANHPMPEMEYHVFDHLGNTRVVYTVDYIRGLYDYSAYGRVTRQFVAGGIRHRFKSTAHERDLETGYDYRGARWSDPGLGRFLSVDPLESKFPQWSSYVYTGDNPIFFIDPDGREMKPYLVYDGTTQTIRIYDDSDTKGDFSDDIFLGEYKAHNNVDSKSNGKWEDGIYPMTDRNTRFTHEGKFEKDGVTLQDSPNGRYGEGGIYRAKDFKETTTEKTRTGMAVHAGRENIDFEKRATMGCVRTTPEAMKAIDNAVKEYGPLQDIIIKNNRQSDNTEKVKEVNPPIN